MPQSRILTTILRRPVESEIGETYYILFAPHPPPLMGARACLFAGRQAVPGDAPGGTPATRPCISPTNPFTCGILALPPPRRAQSLEVPHPHRLAEVGRGGTPSDRGKQQRGAQGAHRGRHHETHPAHSAGPRPRPGRHRPGAAPSLPSPPHPARRQGSVPPPGGNATLTLPALPAATLTI